MLGNDNFPLNSSADNSGVNHGVIVGANSGDIKFLLKETPKIPSLISSIVRVLGEKCLDEPKKSEIHDLTPYKPEEKIEYNCVIKYKELFEEYSLYYSQCEKALDVYDDSNFRSKLKILRCVRDWYLEIKGQLLLTLKDQDHSEMFKIRKQADYLIEKVEEKIKDTVCTSNNIQNAAIEDINIGITCFTCYCFLKCRILEKPK